jgi:type I restriction enzyme S subunit
MSFSSSNAPAVPKLRFPDHTEAWDDIRLKEVADIKRGAGSQYLTYVQTEQEGIRLVRIGDFLGSDPVFVEDTKDMKRFRLQRDDILITGTGATAGITFKVPDKFIDFAFSYNAPRI